MDKKELLQERISLLKNTIKLINYWTLFLLIFSLFLFLISFRLIEIGLLSDQAINETLKFGFSILTLLIPLGLQGFGYIRKNDLLNLKFANDNIENFEKLDDVSKEMINYILKK